MVFALKEYLSVQDYYNSEPEDEGTYRADIIYDPPEKKLEVKPFECPFNGTTTLIEEPYLYIHPCYYPD